MHHGFNKEVAGRFLIRSACPVFLSSGDVSESPTILSRVTDPLYNHSDFTFNADLTPATISDTLGNSTSFTYDACGQHSSSDSLGFLGMNTSYDGGDRLYQLSQYNPSNSLLLRAAYSYDATGRVTQIQNSSGPTFTLGYQYDARSQVTIHVNATRKCATFVN